MVDGLSKDFDLTARVVDIIFARHVMPARGQHAGDGVAHHADASGADCERARGICTQILDLHPLRICDWRRPEGRPGADDRLGLSQHPLVIESEIDESRTRDRHVGNCRIGRDMRGNGFRDGARRHLGHARQTQGVGAGVVGQLVSPTVQPNLSGWHRRQVAARERGG